MKNDNDRRKKTESKAIYMLDNNLNERLRYCNLIVL